MVQGLQIGGTRPPEKPTQSTTQHLRRAAWWLFPLSAAAHAAAMTALVPAMLWPEIVLTLCALGLGFWIRLRQPFTTRHLAFAALFGAFVAFELFGRLMLHSLAVLAGRDDLVPGVSLAYLALAVGVTGWRYAAERRRWPESPETHPSVAFDAKTGTLDRIAVDQAASAFIIAAAVLGVVASQLLRPLFHVAWFVALALVGVPALIGIVGADAIAKTLVFRAVWRQREKSAGRRFLLPPL